MYTAFTPSVVEGTPCKQAYAFRVYATDAAGYADAVSETLWIETTQPDCNQPGQAVLDRMWVVGADGAETDLSFDDLKRKVLDLDMDNLPDPIVPIWIKDDHGASYPALLATTTQMFDTDTPGAKKELNGLAIDVNKDSVDDMVVPVRDYFGPGRLIGDFKGLPPAADSDNVLLVMPGRAYTQPGAASAPRPVEAGH